ncbi:MAG: hypothetical protein LJE74_00140 [Proteobacteria bacterium]|nr:hypothetical protein [Pseudomonadota bacterium]
MSGIFGIELRDGRPVEEAVLVSMGQSMAHRGPDGSGYWREGPLGMGHAMLCSTPESVNEALPFHDPATGLVITADARIDNREELAAKLGLDRLLKDGAPDSQFILAAWCKWGPDCVAHLLGDFAFVIRDLREQRFFCARDHLGIKPFYYHCSDRIFTFASDASVLLQISDVPRRINEARIADYLVNPLEGIDKISTFYTAIHRLPPAHTLTVTQERITIDEYWRPDPTHEIQYQTDAEYVEVFHEIFVESVRARLRCNTRPASMLSGGLDSSTTVAVAQQLVKETGTESLQVFSGVSDDETQCKESYFIREVVAHCDLDACTISPRQIAEHKASLTDIFTNLEEPFDADMTLVMLIYLQAHQQGRTMVLDGVEGDLVHSLSSSYPSVLLKQGKWSAAITEIRGLRQNYFKQQISWPTLLQQTVRPALVPGFLRRLRRRYTGKSGLDSVFKETLIRPEFAGDVDLRARLARLRSHNCPGPCASLRELHWRNILHPFLTVGVERYDRVAALCGVEPRHPLLDKRLVELSLSLPWNQLVRDGRSKYLLRRLANQYLPGEVAWRQGWEHVGWDFTVAWFKQAYAEYVATVKGQEPSMRRYVNNAALDNLIGPSSSMPEEADILNAWTVMKLAAWLDHQQAWHTRH